jgi:hypothetical protein
VRSQPRLRQPRREQIGSGHDPQHHGIATRPRCYSCHEQGRSSIVGEAGARAGNFVERARGQPADRQPLVDRALAKGQMGAAAVPMPAQRLDLGAKLIEALEARKGGGGHNGRRLECSLYVPIDPTRSQRDARSRISI